MVNLVFFSSPIGLGHATRDVAISQHLYDVSKKFVTGGSAPRLFSESGFDIMNLYQPPAFHVERGKLQEPLRWLFKYYSYYKKCKLISSRILEEEKPDLVVSDEDFASLVSAHQKKIKTVLITDILETRFSSGIGSLIEKKMNQSMKDVIKKCDLVIMPENGQDHGNIVRVGPIVRKTLQSREELRKRFSFDKKTIVVSIGGTDAGNFLIEKVLEIFNKIKLGAELIIVSGPSTRIQNTQIRNFGFVNNLHEIIFASDLLISLAGKSTIDESKYYGTPGIFIPIKEHFEQEENAKKEGYSYEDIFRLDKLILEKINEKRNPKPIDGAKRAAELIRKLL